MLFDIVLSLPAPERRRPPIQNHPFVRTIRDSRGKRSQWNFPFDVGIALAHDEAIGRQESTRRRAIVLVGPTGPRAIRKERP
jgi:hypothetical protein